MNEEEQVSREEMAEHLARKEPALQIMNKDYENQRAQTFAHAHNPLILRTKLTELAEYSHIARQLFPKRERFILCADIKNAVFDALKLTIRMERRYHKKTTLPDIDVEIDFLRVLIRESCNLGYITPSHSRDWMRHVDECGAILGGLMKYFNNR